MTAIAVTAPFDGAPIGEAEVSSATAIEQALSAAHRLYRDRTAWMAPAQRLAILRRAAQITGARHEELALQVARESGKPLRDARIEIDRGIDSIHIAMDELRTNAGHVVPMGLNATSAGRLAFTQYEPIGPILGISAFNHPFNLVMHQLAPALAAGAPVILKPSPKTPLSCRSIIEIFTEAGLPSGWAQMVLPATNEGVAALVSDPRIAFLSFIGSAAVGWRLRTMLAPGARCALEHGGVAPVIVAKDAHLETAIPRIARAGFWHAGQACVSVQRVFCDAAIADEVAERIAAFGDTLVTGDPTDAKTDVGPLITHAEVDRVGAWVDEAVAAGAKLLSGARRLSPSCYANTVLFDAPQEAKISQLEVFGPVIAVYSYSDRDAAIAKANALPFSFQAAVFTQDLDTAMHCYRHLDATAVMVNESTLFRVDWMPFAGARQSGHGVGGIPHTMREMQTEKMMVWRSDALN